MPVAKKRRKSWKETTLAHGFTSVIDLDNWNIYGVFVSLALLNIFKDGMWMKILPPYTLFLAHDRLTLQKLALDPREVVGATLGVYGITRAVVSIIAGLLINRLGAQSTFVMTGWLGIIGVGTNICCLLLGSVDAIFFLMFVWGIFDGLWGSCLEVVWARSIIVEKREDVNWARQVVNQCTRALGPVFSLVLFLYCGNQWRIEDMRFVMLWGTILSILPVLTCFVFRSKYEVRQEVNLCDVNRLMFNSAEVVVQSLQKQDCIEDEAGIVKISHFADSKKMGKLRIMKADLRESGFVLGQQFRARFKDVESSEVACTVHFEDPSRDAERVALESISLFLRRDQSVNTEISSMVFNLYPELTNRKRQSQGQLLAAMTTAVWNMASPRTFRGRGFSDRLLPGDITQPNLNVSPAVSQDLATSQAGYSQVETEAERFMREERQKRYAPNLAAANIILVCELLYALAAGFSLRFIDLFLIQDYDLSPVFVLLIAFLECCCGAVLASPTQQLMTQMRKQGYHAKSGALFLWGLSLLFIGILCVPGMPLVAVALAVILMQALNSAPKAYLRAKLLNYLPADRIASYMVWDSLNKATQGGITVVGALVIRFGHYQNCFLCTFGLALTRFVIYGVYTARSLEQHYMKDRNSQMSDHEEPPSFEGVHSTLQYDALESHERGGSITLDTSMNEYVDVAEHTDDADLEEHLTTSPRLKDKRMAKTTMDTLEESESEHI